MTLSSSFQKRAKAQADEVVEKVETTLSAMEAAYKEGFPYETLSEARKAYESKDETLEKNEAIVVALDATRDALSTGIMHLRTIETYISLNVPQMEDGNNFGVTVQLNALKEIGDIKEKWSKSMEELPKYFSTRADAVDKLGLPKQSKTETKTTSQSESTGGKEGDESKTNNSKTTEEKTSNGGAPEYHRIQHIIAIDVQQYFTLKAAMRSVMEGYLVAMDNLLKNRMKIDAPKGNGGGNFGAMY
mmetsp:Transcript_327/g.348  ORF Transcript_327/g.348 Transcript_327/m.348 type:complete len:245 (-) Transcript_327:93-827(-)|eukprot:CAMPEP_0195267760 /NCGR_PEP_ID=MMETSP0706-20130129/12773_1 /TAXON_ID=33640 /ORGANISM="Asterionellopsis glacialis, Strain CCMP134" /LENGTH=244 /DNA_ID=CAMNT_0040322555 /DNA_START=72 /DNA_END=806 /DNA_ORIENTATION=-